MHPPPSDVLRKVAFPPPVAEELDPDVVDPDTVLRAFDAPDGSSVVTPGRRVSLALIIELGRDLRVICHEPDRLTLVVAAVGTDSE